jgi:hypothetical protein
LHHSYDVDFNGAATSSSDSATTPGRSNYRPKHLQLACLPTKIPSFCSWVK